MADPNIDGTSTLKKMAAEVRDDAPRTLDVWPREVHDERHGCARPARQQRLQIFLLPCRKSRWARVDGVHQNMAPTTKETRLMDDVVTGVVPRAVLAHGDASKLRHYVGEC
jgi:hypothetical protein